MAEALFKFNVLSIDLWINGTLALVAVAGFITSLVFSIKSNSNLNQQIKLQNHPILKLREVEEKKPKRVLEIKNIGTGPAFNVKYISGIIEEQKNFVSIEPTDPLNFGSLGIHETYQLEFEEQYDLRSVFLQFAKERTDQEHMIYTLVYYEDIFGEMYVSEARVTLRFNNVLVFYTDSPRRLSKKEIRTLIKEMSEEKYKSK